MEKKQSKRLKKLRRLLRMYKLDGYIVPHNDEYQSEQIHPNSNRLYWLTGFSGSAGNAVILRKKAAIFVDGRYFILIAASVGVTVGGTSLIANSIGEKNKKNV